MNHKEMSRRALAIGFVWGFWLFWGIAGITCLTTGEFVRDRYQIDYGMGRHPEYSSTGLVVAVLLWSFVSFFPMVLEQWKYGRVSRRCFAEFLIALLVGLSAAGAHDDNQDAIYLACFVVMVGLSYSCFRLRQVGLDYLEPLQRADEPDTEKRDEGISGDSILNSRP
ncbi:MAG: hypothetical protein NTZ17_00435 [Phycisphaerae bacterium]|nr:hypothetical protein [Phycisphaerae bacterium]